MADPISVRVDTSGVQRALARMAGPVRISLARSMAVAAGKVLRDEAKQLAPVGMEGESQNPGLLRDSMYLAYKDGRSTDQQQVYAVSWNARRAPHGHLVEFGHWQEYVTYKGQDGNWYTNPNIRLPEPKWVAAHPFLRPAMAAWPAAREAALKRGRERFSDLMAGNSAEDAT